MTIKEELENCETMEELKAKAIALAKGKDIKIVMQVSKALGDVAEEKGWL